MIQKHGPKHEIAENIRNIPTNANNNTKLTITTTSKHCIRESCQYLKKEKRVKLEQEKKFIILFFIP